MRCSHVITCIWRMRSPIGWAADIYTKAFNDGRKWKHACLQIGLLDPSLLSDPDTLKALTPTCDPIKGDHADRFGDG